MRTGGAIPVLTLVFTLLTVVWSQNQEREPPKILKPLAADELFYNFNEDATLECQATGKPNPSFEWFYNSKPIVTNNFVTVDEVTGTLSIKKLSTRDEGLYNCQAKTMFSDGTKAVAVSPKLEIRISRIGEWIKGEDRTLNRKEGEYLRLPCDDPLPEHYGPVTFKWFTWKTSDDTTEELQEVSQNDRVFIDRFGNLHFTYLLRSDVEDIAYFACAMSSAKKGEIKTGTRVQLTVTPQQDISLTAPVLQYSSGMTGNVNKSGLTFEVNQDARLECFFSGYVPNTVPTISWTDNDNQDITEVPDGRYAFERNNHVLVIKSLVESDEKQYSCLGSNSQGSFKGDMNLNVTSKPIWEEPMTPVTVPEGEDAVFKCRTKSAASENMPDKPRWMKNAERIYPNVGSDKYMFSDKDRVLTVKNVQKRTDIACYQCYVSNSVGEVFGDACLNVLLPIVITEEPEKEQVVKRGDIVDLTVRATGDALYPLSYRWIFKNKTYEGDKLPPNVTYDSTTGSAFINTTDLTDNQLRAIEGVYRREVFHQYQKIIVDVDVQLKDKPVVVPVAEAGFNYWIIILIIVILIAIIVILIICCVICRRKMLEGDYPLDRKEQNAGLHPEEECKDSGFSDLSRADYDYFPPDKKSPALDFDSIPMGEGDDESFGSNEYGEEAGAFDEDGSFIGVYKKSAPPAYQQRATESNV